jgi:2-hydroxy-6-oxo-6-(2'-carboxyphenyl)-hexa-2,4-dienoate hydrolase
MGDIRFVDVDGIRTGYFEAGSGEPLVLIHGGGFGSTVSANCFRPLVDPLAEHFHVYVIDKLGQGFTDNPQNDSDYTMAAVIRHIHRFMETMGLQKGTLAPDDPNQPSQAAAAAAAPAQPVAAEPPTPTRGSIRQTLMSDATSYHKEFVTDEYVEAELRVALQPKLEQAIEKMEQLTSQWVQLNPKKMKENRRARGRWWYDDLKRETYARIEAGRLKSPTLIIWGFNDPSGRPKLGNDLYRILTSVLDRTELHFFNRSGHYVFQEYPQKTADQMVSFIRSTQ